MDYYQVLGVPYTASEAEIKKRFKSLAIKYHPDKNPNKADHDKFIQVSEAYETLKFPDKKRAYDAKHNFGYRNYTGAPRRSEPAAHQPSHYASAFFTQFYRPYFTPQDMADQEKTAREERERRDAERDASRAAKLAKERAEEALRNLKQEQTRIVNETKRREHRKKQERDALYRDAKKTTHSKHWGEPFKAFDDGVFKTKMYRNPTSSVREGEDDAEAYGDPENPIVVEDEVEVVEVESSRPSTAEPPVESPDEDESPEDESPEDESPDNERDEDTTMGPSSDDTQGQSPESQGKQSSEQERPQEQPQEPQEPQEASVKQERNPPASPEAPDYSKLGEKFDQFMKRDLPKSKKKAFKLDDLKATLGSDIGNVDFSEVLDSLPDYERPQRPTSRTKKPRLAEYSNGKSQAQTLHTDVNRDAVKGHAMPSAPSVLTMLDFHASPAIKTVVAPTAPKIALDRSVSKAQWEQYVEAVQQYQRQHAAYVQQVVAYMAERAARDAELVDQYNSDYKQFEVYQRCVEQDTEVVGQMHESLRRHATAMDIYKQNCRWMHMVGNS